MSPAEVAAELAAVPEPQRTIAAMLPLSGLPAEWTIGKSGEHYIESFNAENLYKKIDGRAESFLQYGVKGMAYAFYHPTGDASNEIQVYIFEMPDSLKALGKYGSEKPDEAQSAAIGDQGYTSAGSILFYVGKYYTQIVSTQDDPKFAAFAMELAKRVAARQKPGGAAPSAPRRSRDPAGTTAPTGTAATARHRSAAAAVKPPPQKLPLPPSSPSCPPRSGREIPSMSPRTSSAIASSPTSSWPITRMGTSPGRASSGPTATPRKPRRCSRNTSRASRKMAPR